MKSDVNDPVPFMPDDADLPAALRDLRKATHRKFVWLYAFNGGHGSAAARGAGYSDKGEACKVRACVLLQRDDIQAAIDALIGKYLFSLAPKAVLRLEQLLDDPKHPSHTKAIEMALSRSGHGEKSSVDVNVKVAIDHVAEAVEHLRILKGLGVPRAELEQTFRFSGLGRYERLLEERGARQLKQIDVTATEVLPQTKTTDGGRC